MIRSHAMRAPFSREPLASASATFYAGIGTECSPVSDALAKASRPNCLAVLVALFIATPACAAPPKPTYWQDIRPVLRKNCTACHNKRNIKERDVSGGLALDSYEAVRKGARDSVIQPGKSMESLLIQ